MASRLTFLSVMPLPRLQPDFRALAFWITLFLGLLSSAKALPSHHIATGFDRLLAEQGDTLPTGAGLTVTHVEASLTQGEHNFAPDPADSQFVGKTFTLQPADGTVSSHATMVGQYFYGATNSFTPATASIKAYDANTWLGSGFLRTGDNARPFIESTPVQNHSWISTSSDNEAQIIEILQRLDFAIKRDIFVSVVGVNNGSGSSLPALLGQAHNVISVGLTNGNHSAGFTTIDGSGRTKPEIVAPATVTSNATPMVASAALLLRASAQADSALTLADHPLAIKALLLASATKSEVASWSHTTDHPLDLRYGAGELNIYLAHRILRAGRQTASASTLLRNRGWDRNNAAAIDSRLLYFFDLPANNTASGFTAALTWNRIVTATTLWANVTVKLANLTLRLYSADGFNLGALVDESTSAVDNIEYLYRPTLPPGRYALEITGDTANAPFALAWSSLPTVTITAGPPVVRGTGTAATFVFTRAGDLLEPLQVFYTRSGTAVAGVDYTAANEDKTIIPAGETTVTVTFDVTPTNSQTAADATLAVTIDADYTYGLSDNATAETSLHDDRYGAWTALWFNAAERANPAIAGDTADPDADGYSNLLEYALALDPRLPPTSLPLAVSVADDRFSLQYFHPNDRPDLTYTIERSIDLSSWYSGTDYVTETTSPVDGGTEITGQSTTLISETLHQFLRLHITR